MFLIYNISLYLIFLALFPLILLFSLFNIFHFRERLVLIDSDVIDSRKSILLHGASLGEIGIIEKILPELKIKYPGYPFIVSSATLSGKRKINKDMAGIISHSILLPFEFRFSIKKMLKTTNPEIIVITETELWPNLINEAKKFGARLVLINGRISDKAYPRYLLLRTFFKKIFSYFDAIGVQSREYYRRFLKLGADKAIMSVTGNIKQSIKFKKVDILFKNNLKKSLRINKDNKVWIAASTRPGEEEIILGAFKELKSKVPHLSLVLAPRHPKRVREVEAIIKSFNLSFNKKTKINTDKENCDLLILDTLGELSMLFCIADIAFVGGTLKPFGGHNLLEPLPYLVPVCFGPYCETQKESVRLIKNIQCGKEIKTKEQLIDFILSVLNNQGFYDRLVANIYQFLIKSDIRLKANINLI